jgi:hypothetical protein
VLLIHPNDAGTKLLAEQELIERLPSTVKAMDLLTFAEFWRGRCGLHWTATSEKPGEMTIAIRAEYPVSGATFFFQRKIERAENAQALPENHAIVLPPLAAHQELQIRIRYAPL